MTNMFGNHYFVIILLNIFDCLWFYGTFDVKYLFIGQFLNLNFVVSRNIENKKKSKNLLCILSNTSLNFVDFNILFEN